MPKYSSAMICEALRNTKGLIYVAAQNLGCTVQTIHNRVSKDPSVKAVLEEERGKFVDVAELKLYQAVQNGEAWAIALVLKTLGKKRGYIEKQELNVSGELRVGVAHIPVPISEDDWPYVDAEITVPIGITHGNGRGNGADYMAGK